VPQTKTRFGATAQGSAKVTPIEAGEDQED
jgi:hypothetical protein